MSAAETGASRLVDSNAVVLILNARDAWAPKCDKQRAAVVQWVVATNGGGVTWVMAMLMTMWNEGGGASVRAEGLTGLSYTVPRACIGPPIMLVIIIPLAHHHRTPPCPACLPLIPFIIHPMLHPFPTSHLTSAPPTLLAPHTSFPLPHHLPAHIFITPPTILHLLASAPFPSHDSPHPTHDHPHPCPHPPFSEPFMPVLSYRLCHLPPRLP